MSIVSIKSKIVIDINYCSDIVIYGRTVDWIYQPVITGTSSRQGNLDFDGRSTAQYVNRRSEKTVEKTRKY